MDFADALKLLKRGRRVTWPGLPAGAAWIAIRDGEFVARLVPGVETGDGEVVDFQRWNPEMPDILADDWEDMEDIL